MGHDRQATSQFLPTRAPLWWSSSVLLPGSLGWPRRHSEALGGWWWCPWKVTREGNGPDICEWQSGAAASGRHPETETRWRPPTDPAGEYIQSVRMETTSVCPNFPESVQYMFLLTCRYRGRLFLIALSCCVRWWGSSSTSTMRNSSCWALDVASRGLQCFTIQPEWNREAHKFRYTTVMILTTVTCSIL